MTPRAWLSDRACLAMIACDAVIGILVLIGKIRDWDTSIGYAQLLVSYQVGIIRRALIGQLWSLLNAQVVIAHVYILGTVVIIVAVGLFVLVFRSIFRFSSETMPLFVFTAGSPFLFKNFIYTIGYFDVYGCLAALLALALPLNAVYLVIVGGLCAFLLFVHHIHFLLYLPTIGVIALLRHRAEDRLYPSRMVAMGVVATALVGTFVFLAFFLRPPLPPRAFVELVIERARDPVDPGLLVHLWYSTIAQEMQSTLANMPSNLLRAPVYAALILLHLPVITYFATLIRALATNVDRRLVLGGLAGITAGYIVICIVVFDYARWVSGWVVCNMLVMFATRLLPSRAAAPVIARTPRNAILAWIVTLIPRVGIWKPF